MPLVSVVIPSYNDADMLRRCLEALAVQTRHPDEIIVVDTHSTADTAAVAHAAGVLRSNRAIHWIAEHCYIGAYRLVVGAMLGHPVLFGSNLALRRATWVAARARTHHDRADVHDDLDLTINLPPGTHLRFDPHLVVGVSARPFDDVAGLARRVRMAFRTFAVDFAEESLWSRRRAWRREQRHPSAQRPPIAS